MISSVHGVLDAMRRFQSPIEYSSAVGKNINDLFERDPRLLHYYSSSVSRTTSVKVTLEIEYENKDYPIELIYRVNSRAEAMERMRECVGAFRQTLVLCAKEGILDAAVHEFFERYSTFMSMMTKMSSRSATKEGCTYEVYTITFEYRLGRVTLATMEQEVQQEVERLCKMLFLHDMPHEAKILLAHHYLATHIQYVADRSDPLERAYTQSAYGALIRKQCVCQGFAEAFKRLMNHERIDCYAVGGVAEAVKHYTPKSEDHAWNVVSVGGGAYTHVDATWDNDLSGAKLTWFALTDLQMRAKGRQWTDTGVPRCTVDGRVVLLRAKDYIARNRARLAANGVDELTLKGL